MSSLTNFFRGDPQAVETRKRFESLAEIMSRSCDPDADFWYLGGPMTGIPQFNFPRFFEVGDRLRMQGKNICSPAELDDPATEAAALASVDGAPGSGAANGEAYEDFLGRDLIIVSLPTCVGMICMPGWHNSRGARGESWVISYLKKPLYEYDDSSGEVVLTFIDRDERLMELGVPDYARGAVPRDKPGLLTAAENTSIVTPEIADALEKTH